ncbi:MAG: D-alanyl-D-alanine carboxypeptidase [Clostridia bacterium]|nr:D-alanyl-D-alanine carboxypeptidase [Clostridia bacterium]
MKLKRFLPVALCFFIAFSVTVSAKTVTKDEEINDLNEPIECVTVDAAPGTSLDIKAKSAVLMEQYTGDVLYEQNPDEKLKPASITKIMSLILIMEAIERRDFTPEEVVTASEHAASMGGSQIWLEPGEGMTVDDLLKAVVVGSANDATVALAEKIAGSEEVFVGKMNEKAKSLGMNNTTFKNCTGLDAEGHITTAYDVALMSRELLKYPLIKKYSTIWMDSIRNGESELVNTNKLVRFYEGTTGLKTGTTSGAGYCLSASAKRGNTELIAVVMGGDTSGDRFEGAKKMLDFGFANYSLFEISPERKGDELTVTVRGGTEKTVKGKISGTVRKVGKNAEKGQITDKIVLKSDIAAPVKEGDVIGVAEVYIGKEKVGEIPIRAENDVKKTGIFVTFRWILSGLFKL